MAEQSSLIHSILESEQGNSIKEGGVETRAELSLQDPHSHVQKYALLISEVEPKPSKLTVKLNFHKCHLTFLSYLDIPGME